MRGRGQKFRHSFLVSLLLISIAILPILGGLPDTTGAYLTTSYTTLSSTVILTSYAEKTVNLASPYYQKGILTIPKAPAKFACTAIYMAFTAEADEELLISYNSTLPFSFYLMTETGYNNWVAQENCLPNDAVKSQLIIKETESTSLSTTWVVPATGKYYLKFTNIETRKETSVQCAVIARQPSIVSQTTLVLVAETFTQVMESSTKTEGTNVVSTHDENAQVYLVLSIALIAVLLVLAIVGIRRRKPKSDA